MWVLIWVALIGYGAHPDVRMQEFTSKENCQAAIKVIRAGYAKSRDGDYVMNSECVPK